MNKGNLEKVFLNSDYTWQGAKCEHEANLFRTLLADILQTINQILIPSVSEINDLSIISKQSPRSSRCVGYLDGVDYQQNVYMSTRRLVVG